MPQDSNVVPIIRDPLLEIGQRIDAAYARTQRGRQDWIEGSLELAAALLEGRERMGNVAFGAWLEANGHNHLGKNDRGGLMNLGADPILARTALEATKSTSYQTIWSETRIRYPNNRTTNSNTDNRGAVYSTGDGPWTNVIDARLTALIQSGVSRQATADRLAHEFGLPFTKGMVINATRRLGLVERTPAAPRRSPAAAPSRSAPVAPRPAAPASARPLAPEQVAPGFTGTHNEYVQLHGHVSVQTAEQKAVAYLSTITTGMRKAMRALQETRHPTELHHIAYWLGLLRNPRERDVAKLREALEVLEPRVAEARAWLDRAEAALRDRPARQSQAEPAAAPMSSSPTT